MIVIELDSTRCLVEDSSFCFIVEEESAAVNGWYLRPIVAGCFG